jgi:hypothetical protein
VNGIKNNGLKVKSSVEMSGLWSKKRKLWVKERKVKRNESKRIVS